MDTLVKLMGLEHSSCGEHLLLPILRRDAVKQVCLANIFPPTPEVSARHDGP